MIWITIDRQQKTTVARQIFEQIRTKIFSGELKAFEKLPSTRKFARELHVSRNTIIEVYDQLFAEGYIDRKQGAGTYVATGISLDNFLPSSPGEQPEKDSPQGEKRGGQKKYFIAGIPDLTVFPRTSWAKHLKEAVLEIDTNDLDYPDIMGHHRLRSILQSYLKKVKGIHFGADEIHILSGSSEAFTILGELFQNSGKRVLIEDPSYQGIVTILQRAGHDLEYIPVDNDGLITGKLPDPGKPAIIIITPSHQYPTGVILPIKRRIDLINYAAKTDSIIVENDYDSEFRFNIPPVSSLRLLNQERVIHIGTFSETMYPALRLGYMVAPRRFTGRINLIRKNNSMYTSTVKQYALMSFIKSGSYERHVASMKKLYYKKRQYLTGLLKECFQDNIIITGDATGLYIVIEFKQIKITDRLLETLIQKNIMVKALKNMSVKNRLHDTKLIMGYGNLSFEEINQGVGLLKNILFNKTT